jgi:hypothetical protein
MEIRQWQLRQMKREASCVNWVEDVTFKYLAATHRFTLNPAPKDYIRQQIAVLQSLH